jgi:hypothetical protein
MNLWILIVESLEKTGCQFLNIIREHDPLILEPAHIRQFDAPNKLILRGQIVPKGRLVGFEPFHPKPAPSSVPKMNLRLLVEGADESGWVVSPSTCRRTGDGMVHS